MDNGAVFRIWGLGMNSIHRVRYEIHGDRGLIGTAEPNHWTHVKVHHEPWMRKPGEKIDMTYLPDWPGNAEDADRAGHGGGDYWTCRYFAEAIASGRSPFLDVYRATAMAAVSILGWKSCMEVVRGLA